MRIESFAKPEITIGRGANNDFVLAERGVSGTHARLSLLGTGELVLTDLGSTNGTFVNSRRLQGSTAIGLYDEVFICHIRMEVAIGNQEFPPPPSNDPQAGHTMMASNIDPAMFRQSGTDEVSRGATLSGEIGGSNETNAQGQGA